jgi:hypothetical protein
LPLVLPGYSITWFRLSYLWLAKSLLKVDVFQKYWLTIKRFAMKSEEITVIKFGVQAIFKVFNLNRMRESFVSLTPYQTTAIAILLTDSATIASQALFGKTCFFAFI